MEAPPGRRRCPAHVVLRMLSCACSPEPPTPTPAQQVGAVILPEAQRGRPSRRLRWNGGVSM